MQQVERIANKHFGRCYRLGDDHVDPNVTGDFGPRIVGDSILALVEQARANESC